MKALIIISVIFTLFTLVIKFATRSNTIHKPISYLKKTNLISRLAKLIIGCMIFYVWMTLLVAIFNKSTQNYINVLMASKTHNDSDPFIVISLIIFVSITTYLMTRIVLSIITVIRSFITLKKQKNDDVENIFLRSLYTDSNESIVQKYKNWISIPYPERNTLFIEDAMKLIAALLSQEEYEEAQKISEFYIRGNSKIVQTQNTKGITEVVSKEKR
jgi:hypothetical protein